MITRRDIQAAHYFHFRVLTRAALSRRTFRRQYEQSLLASAWLHAEDDRRATRPGLERGLHSRFRCARKAIIGHSRGWLRKYDDREKLVDGRRSGLLDQLLLDF